MNTTVVMNNLLSLIQSMSLTTSNKRWLADHLYEEVRAEEKHEVKADTTKVKRKLKIDPRVEMMKLNQVKLERCLNMSSVKLPAGLETIDFLRMPKLTSYDFKQFKGLRFLWLMDTSIADVDLSNMTYLEGVTITSFDVETGRLYPINTFDVSGCTALGVLTNENATIKKATFKGHPYLGSINITDCTLTDISVESCGARWITVYDNHIDNLTIKECPEMNETLDCHNNELKVLLLDNLPHLPNVDCRDNHLMFLDLSGMQLAFEGAEGSFNGDNQTPSAVAYRLSATEVGLRVHERFDVTRVKNLEANGKAETPAWSTIDDKKNFVFSTDGANAESLKGQKTTYEYETQWPYSWQEGNSKDNNLPVVLNITSTEKLPSWIKLSSTETLKSMVDGTLAPLPTVTRSDKYDGALTWTSSNPSAVTVNATTGALTIASPGSATITVSGAETFYRTAPAAQSYPVVVYAYGDATCDGLLNSADVAAIVATS